MSDAKMGERDVCLMSWKLSELFPLCRCAKRPGSLTGLRVEWLCPRAIMEPSAHCGIVSNSKNRVTAVVDCAQRRGRRLNYRGPRQSCDDERSRKAVHLLEAAL